MKILSKISSANVNALILLLITLLFITGTSAKAGWEYVGNPSFVNNNSFTKCLAFLENTPYISLSGSVMKYDGTDWVFVGPANAFNGGNSSIAFSGSTPYIAFIDIDHGGKISVMKFNGNEWEYVGNPGFSAKSIFLYALLSISNGVPYVGFIEADDFEHKLVGVMKFDGTNWNYVGNLGVPAYPNWLSFAVNSGIPYVAYTSSDGGARAIVRKYDGVSWLTVGQSPIGSGTTEYNSLVFCETPPYENVPYIAFSETEWDVTRIKRFNGNDLWVNVGSAIGTFTHEQSLAMSGIIPYVAFETWAGLNVHKHEGGDWIDMSPNIQNANWPCLVINNGTPYVSFNSGGSVSVIMYLDHPLPVELNAFTSQAVGRNVYLTWSTSAETNNFGFEIERKSINSIWTKTGFVEGHGTVTVPENYTFTDRNLTAGTFKYRLKQLDLNGNFHYFNLSDDVSIGIPLRFEVYQNYPNPFNPATKISFDLPFESKVSVKVYDMSGKEIVTLINEVKSAGYYSVDFNAAGLSSGIYLYKVTAGSLVTAKKMTIIK